MMKCEFYMKLYVILDMSVVTLDLMEVWRTHDMIAELRLMT